MSRQGWAAQLRNARTTAEQIGVLKALKNEVLGHVIKKELAVAHGVLDPLVRLTFNKAGVRQDSKSHDHSFASRPLNGDETIRLQGLVILASLAAGGPPFLVPLQGASVMPALLSNLCPSNNPTQLVLASLRGLSNLATSAALASPDSSFNVTTLAAALFTRQHLGSLCRIISQPYLSIAIQNQISIAASLISGVCKEERHKQALANSGVLDALATKLASFVIAEGLVPPGAEILAERDGLQEYFPPPAPKNANLSVILEAIAVIIANSKFRASQLLYSPSMLAIFPAALSEFSAPQNTRAAWNAFNLAGLGGRQSPLNATDYLLPFIPSQQLKNSTTQTSAFPPLGAFGSREILALNGRHHKYNIASPPSWTDPSFQDNGLVNEENSTTNMEEPETQLVAYLFRSVRAWTGFKRLMAASVLTTLYRAGLSNKIRETYLGLLVVPLLVQMLDDPVMPPKWQDDFGDDAIATDWAIKERAPAILAMLITDSEFLQKAAYDANLLSKLSKLLKVSYDPVPESSNPQPWTPYGTEDGNHFDARSLRIGHEGQSPLLVHRIKVRESTLKAIAALVSFKDEYRKAIVEQGMVPYIVESMSSKPGKPSPKPSDKSEQSNDNTHEIESIKAYGINPVSIQIAACGVVRALSRSVGVLRTTLIDNGVAEPIVRLLEHPDIEVQIAATAVMCNLLTDVSPMRNPITQAGAIKVLCKHVRSTSAKLRLNAVWALKHFVLGISNDQKKACLDELEVGWLVRLICADTEDEALSSSKIKSERGQTSNDEMDEDVDMDQFEEQIESSFGSSSGRPSNLQPSSGRNKAIQQAEIRLAALREAETNPTNKARKDDITVQEQGLEFIRNLIGGAGNGNTPENTEMIDFLFNALGQDNFFEILANKVRPKVLNPYTRRNGNASAPETKIVPPQPEIMVPVIYILVHMAASVPRHRQLVIAQTELLKLLVPHMSNPNTEVRTGLLWLITNLTWMDDQDDAQSCIQRSIDLRNLGFLDKLETLGTDPEFDIRERAKRAISQMNQIYMRD